MLNEPKYLDLIVRYLNNPLDDIARSKVNALCAKSPQNESYFKEVERIWNLSSKAARLDLSVNDSEFKFKPALQQLTHHSLINFKWLAAAAAIVIIAGIGFIIFNHQNANSFLTKETLANQKDSIILVDGSKVFLEGNTILKYPKNFEKTAREVYLDKGKAFFKITRNPKHPFSIQMGESNIIVLGTSFNLDYKEDRINLDVKTGRVLFSPYLNGASAILTSGQALSYDIVKKEFTTKLSHNPNAQHLAELTFVDTPLEEVCNRLSEFYQIKIILDTKQPLVKKFNATFKQNSLDEVLEVLKETYGLNIKKSKENITLKVPQ
ncbi:FecR family protein [Pedobacter mucosus]|uniref:FecR family protein n=1 Tax=Pedobacter mucosus TaxID=2895286 RepID=UPI001EE3A364|nr:FecR family protein [Pedobacter mucosus]UKT63122.1 FecR family protein [Pedobacter mucosus]